MAKRELSSTLKNLKFMQRAAQREEKIKKEEDVKPDGNFFSTPNLNTRCMVIMEGDPHPGAIKGRMSFQSFNPSIDKLNEEAANHCQPEASGTSADQNERISERENGSLNDGAGSLDEAKATNSDTEDLKRKQSNVVSGSEYPNKSQKNVQTDPQPSPSSSRGSYKQQKRKNLDWSVLRPPKCPNKPE